MSEDRRERAVEYLLGEMNEAERSGFEAECRTDAELAATVEELRPVVTKLDSLPDQVWDAPEPPPLVMPGTPPDASPADSTSGARTARAGGFGWLRIGAAVIGAFAILAVGVLIGTQIEGDGSGPSGEPVRTLALETIGDEAPADATGQVKLTSSNEDPVTLDVSGLDPTGPKEFYELWLLGKDGELVALGTFRVKPDGGTQIEVPLPVDPEQFEYFDVSIQPDNGDPGHSGRSVLRGVTRA